MSHACPTCGHVTSTRKPRAAVSAMPERADIDRQFHSQQMTQPAYYDACKRIARRDDLRFLICVAGSDLQGVILADAMTLLAALETRKATAADVTAINSIRDRYRMSKGSLIVRAGSPESIARATEQEARELVRIEAEELATAKREERIAYYNRATAADHVAA